MKENPQPEEQISYLDGKITFTEAVKKYFPLLCKNRWRPSTQKTYKRDYRVLASYFKEKALQEFADPEYFSAVIDDLRLKLRKTARSTNPNSTQKRIRHFEYLIEELMNAASKGEGFVNPFLEENDSKAMLFPGEEQAVRKRTKIQRSFSPMQELSIFTILMKDPLCDGRLVGLLLSAVFGYRNKESVGLSWGDLQEMPEHKELFMMVLHTTAIKHTRNIHSVGKTHNFDRILPCVGKIYNFFEKRKEHILKLIGNGDIKLEGETDSFEKLPVACKGQEWTVRATSNELSLWGQKLFKEAGLTDEQLSSFAPPSKPTDPLEALAWDADMVTYTFRKAFITHLAIAGASLAQIQYCAGHDITADPNLCRNDFVNPDKLYKLYKIFEKRPIINDIVLTPTQIDITRPFRLGNARRFSCRVSGLKGRVRLMVRPNVACEEANISATQVGDSNNANPVPVVCYQKSLSAQSLDEGHPVVLSENPPCMLGDYYDAYARAEKSLQDEINDRQQQKR